MRKKIMPRRGRRGEIRLGDRVFARLYMHGEVIAEMIFDKVDTMTDVVGELRQATRRVRGLAVLYVCNMSRGWTIERPLMLYPGSFDIRDGDPLPGWEKPRMLMPWETH